MNRTVVLTAISVVMVFIVGGWVVIDSTTGHVDSYVTFIGASIIPTLMSLAAYLRIESVKTTTDQIQKQTNGHMTALIEKVGPIDERKDDAN